MTEPAYVELEVLPEEVRLGDLLPDDDGPTDLDPVAADPIHDPVTEGYWWLPLRSGRGVVLLDGIKVAVRRPAPAAEPAPLAQQVAEVRDLALALAEQAGPGAARVRERAERVRAHLPPPVPPAPTAAPTRGNPK